MARRQAAGLPSRATAPTEAKREWNFTGDCASLNLTSPPKTASRFGQFIRENADVFRRYFGVALYPGSLNVDVTEPSSLQLSHRERRRSAFIPSTGHDRTCRIQVRDFIAR
jgi:hypothetical protein